MIAPLIRGSRQPAVLASEETTESMTHQASSAFVEVDSDEGDSLLISSLFVPPAISEERSLELVVAPGSSTAQDPRPLETPVSPPRVLELEAAPEPLASRSLSPRSFETPVQPLRTFGSEVGTFKCLHYFFEDSP